MIVTSYATDIRPMFTPKDVACMTPQGVKLDDYKYMSDPAGDATYADHANARAILDRVSGKVFPRMPKGGSPWPDAQIETFQSWIAEGCAP